MKDMLDIVRGRLLANPDLATLTEKRIYKYEYPESADHSQLFVTIVPLRPPQVRGGGSNQILSYEFMYQINVESKDRKQCKQAQQLILKELLGLNFAQISGGLDEYFAETKRFVDARRYVGTTNLYDTNY